MRRAVFYNEQLDVKVMVDMSEETFQSIKKKMPNKEFECFSQLGMWVLQDFSRGENVITDSTYPTSGSTT